MKHAHDMILGIVVLALLAALEQHARAAEPRPPSDHKIVSTHVRTDTLDGVANLPGHPGAPNSELPRRVKAERQKVTLWADFGDVRRKNYIVLYLVNSTEQDIVLDAQDGDLYVKQEAFLESGEWQRVQPHQYSFCGNSYHKVKLKAGTFYKFLGLFPKEGKDCKVRYQMFGTLRIVSNVGDGKYDLRRAGKAQYDGMTAGYGDFKAVRKMALGQEPVKGGKRSGLQLSAVRGLSRFKTEEAVDALMEVIKSGDNRLRQRAVQALGEIGEPAAKAIPLLIRLMDDSRWMIVIHSVQSLGKLGPLARNAVPRLVRGLDSTNKYRRRISAGALGKMGKPAHVAVPHLRRIAAKDKDKILRDMAAKALTELGYPLVDKATEE